MVSFPFPLILFPPEPSQASTPRFDGTVSCVHPNTHSSQQLLGFSLLHSPSPGWRVCPSPALTRCEARQSYTVCLLQWLQNLSGDRVRLAAVFHHRAACHTHNGGQKIKNVRTTDAREVVDKEECCDAVDGNVKGFPGG